MAQLTLRLMEYIAYIGDNVNSRAVNEGEEVLNAGHIILYGKSEMSHFSLKVCALCLQTSALQSDPHEMNGELTISNGFASIKQMYCTCKAGAGGKCKHISAFLILLTRKNLLELEDISQTELACAWSGRKQIVHDKYKAVSVLEMPCIKLKVNDKLVLPKSMDEQKSMLAFFIKNLPDSAIAKLSKGRGENDLQLSENDNDKSMPKDISLDEEGCEILK